MKISDDIAMRALVKECVAASEMFHAHKSALKAAGPKGNGNLRQVTRECEKQAYRATFDDIRGNARYVRLQTKYEGVYDRIEQAYQHKP